MKNILQIIAVILCFVACSEEEVKIDHQWDQPTVTKFYKGSTVAYGKYLERHHGVVFQENGVQKDPYVSLKDHGANMVRLTVKHADPEVTKEQINYPLDIYNWEQMKIQIKTAKDLGLEVVLTMLSDNGQAAPTAWLGLSRDEMAKEVYNFVYEKLDYLASHGMMPSIVAIGNENNNTFCYYNENYDDPTFQKEAREHGVIMMNKGFEAVDAINTKYGTKAKKLLHIAGPNNLQWVMGEWVDKGQLVNFDIVGLSYYVGHKQTLGTFNNFAHLCKWLWLKYRKQMLIIETSMVFTTENGDNGGQVASTPAPGYEVSPKGQRKYMEDLAQDVANGGGLGVIYWGGDWVGKDVYVFTSSKGSTWDDKAFWTSTKGSDIHELHEGIDWMKRDYLAK